MAVCVYVNRIAFEYTDRISSLQTYLNVLFVPHLSGSIGASKHYWKISLKTALDYYDL